MQWLRDGKWKHNLFMVYTGVIKNGIYGYPVKCTSALRFVILQSFRMIGT